MASFNKHKIIWIYKVQYDNSKNGNFLRTLKMDLGPFGNKLFIYESYRNKQSAICLNNVGGSSAIFVSSLKQIVVLSVAL